MIPPIYLLDTHTLLWFLQGNPRLSPKAKGLVEDQGNRVLVSIVSCWEIAIKTGQGTMNLSEPSRTLLQRELPGNDLELLPISLDHATAVEGLPRHHKDPFDRLLIAQAMIEGVPIISVDGVFDHYPVRRIW